MKSLLFFAARAFGLGLASLSIFTTALKAEWNESFLSHSIAESKHDDLFVTELIPSTGFLEWSGKRVPITEAWVEKRSTADGENGRKAIPGFILAVKFEVPRGHGSELFRLHNVGPQGGGVQSFSNGVVIINEFVSEKTPTYTLRFRDGFDASLPVVCVLELRSTSTPPVGAQLIAPAPLTFSTPRTIPDLGLTLNPIAAGSFTMGSPPNEAGRSPNEGPQTRVTLSHAFWMARTETTQAQWKEIMGTTVSDQIHEMLLDETLYHLDEHPPETLRDYYRSQKDGGDKLLFNTEGMAPVYFVNWYEAVTFCQRLTARERGAGRLIPGYEYRLPTEAEWEYACRAGTTEATYAGNLVLKGKYNAPVLDSIAWYGGNSSVGYTGKGRDTSQLPEKQYPGGVAAQRTVATKAPNAWGLYDMLGNVWEWCGDRYSKLPGGAGSDPQGGTIGTYRVWRGGSYSYELPSSCRSASRAAAEPTIRVSDLGFRIVLGPVQNFESKP